MNTTVRKAFIFAAGRGVRVRPYTNFVPKPLFLIDGIPLVVRSIRQLKAAFLGLDKIYVLVNHHREQIKAVLENLETSPLIEFIEISDADLDTGLLGGYAAIAPLIEPEELFISVLSDEFYGGSDHSGFADFIKQHPNLSGVCAVKRFEYPDEYFKNYAVTLASDRQTIKRIVEKPADIQSEYFGLGLLVARGRLCHAVCAEINANERKDFFSLLGQTAQSQGVPLLSFEFKDDYVNINFATDIYQGQRLVRARRKHSVDVIIPAWNEADSIGYVVSDFARVCDNVIVVDNVSPDNTAEIARQAGATVISQPTKGYGDAIKTGLDSSEADILVVVEADGTFRAKDLGKLLTYLMDADAVIGSRTYWQYVEYGANMDHIQRFANMLFGMIITALWWNRKSRFTDVGCSYRAIWRTTYLAIEPRLRGKGPEFAPEFVIELLQTWHRVIEVPIPYHSRILGESKFSGSFLHLAKTAMKMLNLMLSRRAESWGNNLKYLLWRGR